MCVIYLRDKKTGNWKIKENVSEGIRKIDTRERFWKRPLKKYKLAYKPFQKYTNWNVINGVLF